MYRKICRLGVFVLVLATIVSCGLKNKESDIYYEASKLTKESDICDGYQIGKEKYKQGKYAESFEIWYPLAKNGCARAQTSLGALYEIGKGVPRDLNLALDWLLKAADKKEPYAYYYLGMHHLRFYLKSGKLHDRKEAEFWFEKAKNTDIEQVREAAYERLKEIK